ncbi:MAG: FAD-dependent oxidoreductase [Candidatus Yanofskybacteria bacterium]|nr:FAD-dependent oxidoreductase [Candidatus Yanofskybacteria bacterium]
MTYDLVIIGTGAAGLSAAIYAERYKLNTLLIGEEFGGETATAGAIENWPGNKIIDGYELMAAMKEQALAAGAEIREGRVIRVKKKDACFDVFTEKESVHAKAVILAIGAQRRHLNLPNEKELTGKGVHYCVTCDGPVYAKKTVAMVGGGDSSVKGVNFLAEYAEKIYLITREKEPHAEPVNMERMKAHGEKVEILAETQVKEIVGEKKLESLVLSRSYRGEERLAVDGLFVEIGFDPDKTFADQLGLELDERGYLKADNMMRTNVPGVFPAGDAVNHFEGFKQDITAAALGAVAATSAYDYVRKNGSRCEFHASA